jgi:hypothetical protein
VTNYNKATGSSGTMQIRDNGIQVEFWINSNNSSTFNHELPWGYTVNGSTSNNRTYNYNAGAGWQRLGTWMVATDQTITFRLFDTGTSGFGGPTTLSVTIDRAQRPNPPSIPTAINVPPNQAFVKFTDGANNGAAIDQRQIGFGTDPRNVQHLVDSDGSTTIVGLANDTTYYVWARTHNAKGWSDYGPRTSFKTPAGPPAPQPPVISNIDQTSLVISFSDNGDGGLPITSRQIGYSTSPTGTPTIVPYSGVTTVTGLAPATTYYFWTRVRNVLAYSPWSAVRVARTTAGAWVKDGPGWKEAVPYVNVGGVWKLAQPWGRVAGVWKPTT